MKQVRKETIDKLLDASFDAGIELIIAALEAVKWGIGDVSMTVSQFIDLIKDMSQDKRR